VSKTPDFIGYIEQSHRVHERLNQIRAEIHTRLDLRPASGLPTRDVALLKELHKERSGLMQQLDAAGEALIDNCESNIAGDLKRPIPRRAIAGRKPRMAST
jgi:hypothetical protein